MIVSAPASSAARISSPVPYDVVAFGSRSDGRSSASPLLGGGLHDRGAAVAEQREPGLHRASEGIVRAGRQHRAAGGVGQRPRGSLSPVSHGQASYFGVGVAAADAFGHDPCRLGGGQALLEGIRRT